VFVYVCVCVCVCVCVQMEPVPAEEEDSVAVAKAYYDVREFRRAVHALRDCKCNTAIFLRGYCLYMAGEQRKEDEGGAEQSGSSQGIAGVKRTPAANAEIANLNRELSDLNASGSLDGFGKFLYGVVLKQVRHSAIGRPCPISLSHRNTSE
jgi:anaphase-promoting complex subunit 8